MSLSRRRFMQASTGITALSLSGAAPIADEARTYDGKVRRLADIVAGTGAKLDSDAAPFWLALRTADGQLYPLIKDAASRLFFKDATLLDRPMRLQGKLLPGSSVLRVTRVNSLRKGEVCELYYWCDICSIKRGEKMVCECCGGPMELQEEPTKN